MKLTSFGGTFFFFAWRKGGVGERVVGHGIDEMGGVDFDGSQSHSMYLRFGGGYVGPGTKVEAYDSQRDSERRVLNGK
jgi:hypothetical protein